MICEQAVMVGVGAAGRGKPAGRPDVVTLARENTCTYGHNRKKWPHHFHYRLNTWPPIEVSLESSEMPRGGQLGQNTPEESTNGGEWCSSACRLPVRGARELLQSAGGATKPAGSWHRPCRTGRHGWENGRHCQRRRHGDVVAGEAAMQWRLIRYLQRSRGAPADCRREAGVSLPLSK